MSAQVFQGFSLQGKGPRSNLIAGINQEDIDEIYS